MKKLNNKKGISLIVLVITIIVMIILAAAIILSLQSSGIIGKANEAKIKTDVANAKQVVAMAKAEWELMTANEQSQKGSFKSYAEAKLKEAGYSTSGNGGIKLSESGAVNLIYAGSDDKTAIIPDGFSVSTNSAEDSVSEGLVIKDSLGNEWVWIEVPKDIYVAATSSTDYENIEKDMTTYTSSISYNNYISNVWSDFAGTVWDGKSDYGYGYGIINASKLADIEAKYGVGKLYTSSDLTTVLTSSNLSTMTGAYYIKVTDEFLSDKTVFGLTANEYYSLKNQMLKSVYENGGFWVGRYEAGTSVPRSAVTDDNSLSQVVLKPNMYPYNYITSNQAQKLATGLSTGEMNSSIMFPIQWKLMLKCMVSNGCDLSVCGTKGNLWNYEVNAVRGQRFLESWMDNAPSWNKMAQFPVLLTTGAIDSSIMHNTYDLAGNVSEMLLGSHVMVYSGAFVASEGLNYSLEWSVSAFGHPDSGFSTDSSHGFRPVMW